MGIYIKSVHEREETYEGLFINMVQVMMQPGEEDTRSLCSQANTRETRNVKYTGWSFQQGAGECVCVFFVQRAGSGCC